MPDDTIHPIVPLKACVKCDGQPIRIATETRYFIYFRCDSCAHMWAEDRPPGSLPPPNAVWDKRDT